MSNILLKLIFEILMKILEVSVIIHNSIATYFIFISVYKKDVIKLCTQCKNCVNPKCNDKFYRSVLILVPVRLGSEGLNTIYIPCLQVSAWHVSRINLFVSQQPMNCLWGWCVKGYDPIELLWWRVLAKIVLQEKFFSLKALYHRH